MKNKLIVIVTCLLLISGCEKTESGQKNSEPKIHKSTGTVVQIDEYSVTIALSGKTKMSVFDTRDVIMDMGAYEYNTGIQVKITYIMRKGKKIAKKMKLLKPSEEMLVNKKIIMLIDQMSLEEKVGQLFFVRCPQNNAIENLERYHIGGYVLFGRDFANQSPASASAMTASYQAHSKIPLFIGVDEEGGTVNRISIHPSFRAVPFHSPQSLYAEGGFDLVTSDTKEKDTLLKSLGVNVNFAPVSDLSMNPEDFIYDRAFGQNANMTGEYVKTVITQMSTDKVGSVLKHFPGYGNNADTHVGFAVDRRSIETYQKEDLIPFIKGIESGADSVLVNHVLVTSMDADTPASLSASVHQLLRSQLKFKGVIMTDDLAMDAVRAAYGDEAAAIKAVQAGNDIILSTYFEVQIPAVVQAVQNGQISETDIDQSLIRILKWKYKLNLLTLN
ncbi:beta-hexosaminidase [Clostridiaceae bacterium DONG20-135]|uniref:Beta-hexosaminidase n=1 Tax=Copranaerobaculum intestinale TaxID=2692629 RepID=A0A6N8U4Q1_9FIRM|nr:glycoside hydrolase family 3 N-terminal domain-containing protein [Copranaerobaculum intestinale]MXQ72930.1 beta-hexosaminidase [Copranaerobaculum intestinale]